MNHRNVYCIFLFEQIFQRIEGNEQDVAQQHKIIADALGKKSLLRDEERSIRASLNGIILPSRGRYSVHELRINN